MMRNIYTGIKCSAMRLGEASSEKAQAEIAIAIALQAFTASTGCKVKYVWIDSADNGVDYKVVIGAEIP